MKPECVILDGYTTNPGDNPWTPIEELTRLTVYDRTEKAAITERARNAEIILTNKTPLDQQALDTLPKLKLISVLATGFNIVDIKAARERGISVCNVPTYSTDIVAQHTFALLLELCHQCGLHSNSVHDGEWSRSPDFSYWKSPLFELKDKTLGIAGYGRIGKRVAEIAEAFGMRVIFFSRHNLDKENALFVNWETFLQESDVISLHCALTPESEQMMNKEAFEKMKDHAFLINTGRGGLIDESALRAALESQVIAGAAVDVLSSEPPRKNPLIGSPRCMITPHIAWTGIGARRNLMKTTRENIQAYLKGNPIHVVN